MPRKGQRLSRSTNRYSYNVNANKRNETYKIFKEGIRNSNRSTSSSRRRSSRRSRKFSNIAINTIHLDESAVIAIWSAIGVLLVIFTVISTISYIF